jgi:hypothetical protein
MWEHFRSAEVEQKRNPSVALRTNLAMALRRRVETIVFSRARISVPRPTCWRPPAANNGAYAFRTRTITPPPTSRDGCLPGKRDG